MSTQPVYRIRLANGLFLADYGTKGLFGCGVAYEHAGLYSGFRAARLLESYKGSTLTRGAVIEHDDASPAPTQVDPDDPFLTAQDREDLALLSEPSPSEVQESWYTPVNQADLAWAERMRREFEESN